MDIMTSVQDGNGLRTKMLYKKQETKGEWHWISWRYWCDCMSPTCILEFIDNSDSGITNLEIGINSNPNWSFWKRLKEAIKLMFGKEIRYLEVVISEKDRIELGRAITGKYDKNV